MIRRAMLLLGLVCAACGGPAALAVDMPLHLEDHVDVATVIGSELPADPPQPVEWRFDEPQPDWKPTPLWNPPFGVPLLTRTGEGLRVALTDRTRVQGGLLRGVIHVEVPDWDRADWTDVLIRARADSASSVNIVALAFNLRDGRGPATNPQPPFQFVGQNSPVVRDGTIHTYRLRVGEGSPGFTVPWRQLLLIFGSEGEPGSIELLSVSVVPTAAAYAEAPHGVRPVTIGNRIRRTLYTHAPASMAYDVRVPEQGRVDVGLGVLTDGAAVTFAMTATLSNGTVERLFEEHYADAEMWGQRSVDLSRFAGQTVTLTLEAQAERPGTVALWGSPTVSGTRSSEMPNVIFYVIDGGGADQMSLYGYNRRTTPNLERLAAEGAVFEHAYSTCGSTRCSTPSFMTSLQISVLGAPDRWELLPAEARTMAERFHEAGHPTAVFTSNPNAGTISSLERGVDVFRDQGVPQDAGSSVELHGDFWDWRDTSPGEPYWVHFQTTDVHGSRNRPPAPFAGLFTAADDWARFARWDSTLGEWQSRNAARVETEPDWRRTRFTETGIDRREYYNLDRSFYDERMAHQDHQLGRLIERLKEAGQWENTLLIVAADHSIESATGDFVVPLTDPEPPDEHWTTLRSSVSRVPLLFVWPGRIAGGQRFPQPVSMIDVLPTVLELVGLPPPEVMQGQSLAPLLRGRIGWQSRPVIFDEVGRDAQTRELEGTIAMIDGRWGASLRIRALAEDPTERLLLFDVWNDPFALTLMNDSRPELVTKYTALLERQWEAHQLLAQRFTPGDRMELSPEQLETLRSLGYIR